MHTSIVVVEHDKETGVLQAPEILSQLVSVSGWKVRVDPLYVWLLP